MQVIQFSMEDAEEGDAEGEVRRHDCCASLSSDVFIGVSVGGSR